MHVSQPWNIVIYVVFNGWCVDDREIQQCDYWLYTADVKLSVIER